MSPDAPSVHHGRRRGGTGSLSAGRVRLLPRRPADFTRFWVGETISLVGTEVAELALVLTAVVSLQASPLQISVLVVVRFVPYAALSLFAGVWFDTHRRRPTLIVANLGRSVVIGLVPLTWALDHLTIGVVDVAVFALGLLSVVFDVGSQSYIPDLAGRNGLASANSKIQASYAVAGVAGPGIAGLLVGALSAPLTLCVNATTYLISAASLASIRHREPPPESIGQEPMMAAIRSGLAAVVANRLLRHLAVQSGVFNLFENMMLAVLTTYAVRVLGIPVSTLGVILGLGATGALVGASTAGSVTSRFGVMRTMRAATLLACLPPSLLLLLRPAAPGSEALLAATLAVHGAGLAVFNVDAITLRQTVTPPDLLGRMNASYRLLLYVTVPMGALTGGVLADALSLRVALTVAVLGIAAVVAWLFFSPVYDPAHQTVATTPRGGRDRGRPRRNEEVISHDSN